jgi:hypothetical protein
MQVLYKKQAIYFIYFGLFQTDLFVSVVSILIRNTEFRFVSVRTENLFYLFRGHPILAAWLVCITGMVLS